MISQETVDMILKLYNEKHTSTKIANQLSINTSVINYWLNKNGIFPKHKRLSKSDIRKIIADYQKGISIKDIERKYDISKYTIFYNLKKHGYSPSRDTKKIALTRTIINNIEELWNQGYNKAYICKENGISIKELRKVLLELGYSLTEINKCRHIGDKSPSWKGGRYINKCGYIEIILSKDDPFYDKMCRRGRNYVLEHRYVMAKYLNRPLERHETVHHIDGNKENNDISNLQLRIGSHGAGQICYCLNCGSNNISYKEIPS